MNRIFRNHRKKEPIEVYEADPPFYAAIEPNSHRDRFRLLSWLAGAICIFALLYGSSYLALFWLPPYKGVDMKSQLSADYTTWAFVVFQPVDPAVIEEIRQERGLPEQVILNELSLPTSTSMPEATSDDLPLSPTASQPSYASTSSPTSIISLPDPTETLKPAETPVPDNTLNPAETSVPNNTLNPAKTPKPQKTPKPHKTPEPEQPSKPPKTPKP